MRMLFVGYFNSFSLNSLSTIHNLSWPRWDLEECAILTDKASIRNGSVYRSVHRYHSNDRVCCHPCRGGSTGALSNGSKSRKSNVFMWVRDIRNDPGL